jgi:hypothetical protein
VSGIGAPGARLQYDLAKRFAADREPTHEEWARDYDTLAAENARLRLALRQAIEYVEADSSETFAELAEWRDALRGEGMSNEG